MDIQGNVVPFISGEEEKMESEPQKLLGKWDGTRFVEAGLGISAHCNRVPVLDGHLECVSLGLKKIASLAEVREALRTFEVDHELAALPTALRHPVIVMDEENRPQPRRDVEARSEEHTSELQSRLHLVCRLLLEKKKNQNLRMHAHHIPA